MPSRSGPGGRFSTQDKSSPDGDRAGQEFTSFHNAPPFQNALHKSYGQRLERQGADKRDRRETKVAVANYCQRNHAKNGDFGQSGAFPIAKDGGNYSLFDFPLENFADWESFLAENTQAQGLIEGPMLRTISTVVLLTLVAATVGCCRMCAHPFDYYGPVYCGGSHPPTDQDVRAGSVLSPPICRPASPPEVPTPAIRPVPTAESSQPAPEGRAAPKYDWAE